MNVECNLMQVCLLRVATYAAAVPATKEQLRNTRGKLDLQVDELCTEHGIRFAGGGFAFDARHIADVIAERVALDLSSADIEALQQGYAATPYKTPDDDMEAACLAIGPLLNEWLEQGYAAEMVNRMSPEARRKALEDAKEGDNEFDVRS